MAESALPNFGEKTLNETLEQITKLASQIADAIETNLPKQETEDSFTELESKAEEAKESDRKRRSALEERREQNREKFRRKWQRY
jgi:hypothetical protein